jgi:hypothetical protein
MGNDIDDIQNKLDAIEARKNDLINQTPAEYNATQVKDYYEDVLRAQRIKDEAPGQLKNAEEKYYKARFGDKYMDVLLEKYTAESKDVLQSMMDAHQKQLSEVDTKIKTYDASISYYNNINEVKQTWSDKVKKWVLQIQNSRASLNNRKTFFADQKQVELSNWILLENCIILSFILVTCIVGFKQLDKLKIVGLIALTCVVFFMNTMVSWLRYLPKSVTYYTQWGYDPMESKVPWFLVISLVVFVAICIAYVNALTSFFINMKENVQRYRRGEPLVWNNPQWRRDASGRWVRVAPVNTRYAQRELDQLRRLQPLRTNGLYRPTPQELAIARARQQNSMNASIRALDSQLEARQALARQRALASQQALARQQALRQQARR